MQSLWSHFYTQVRVDYVCYVVDSSDEAALKREYASLHTLVCLWWFYLKWLIVCEAKGTGIGNLFVESPSWVCSFRSL